MYKSGEDVFQELSRMTPEQRGLRVYEAPWTDEDMRLQVMVRLKGEPGVPHVAPDEDEKAELEALLESPQVMSDIVMLCCERATKYSNPTVENICGQIKDYVDNIMQHAKDGDHCVR